MASGYSLLSRGKRLGRTSFLMSCSKPLCSNSWRKLDNQCRSFWYIDIYQKMFQGNINIVSGNATCTPSSFLKTVLNKIRTHMASCNINTIPLKVSLYAQWLSQYSCSQNTYTKTPSGYISTIPGNTKQYAQWLSQNVRPVTISIHAPSGNIKNSPGNINLYVHWLSQNSVL